MAGVYPLAENVYRVYKMKISKLYSGECTPADVAILFSSKLFGVVESLPGRHVLRVLPFNPVKNSQEYPMISGVRRDHKHLPGAYVGNI